MFSNYFHKILNPNTPTPKEVESKTVLYSTNTLQTKRVSTLQKINKSNETETLHRDNAKLQSLEPTLPITRKSILPKNSNELYQGIYNTNTYTTTSITKKITNQVSNTNFINLAKSDNSNNNEYNTNSYTHKFLIAEKNKTENEKSQQNKETTVNPNKGNVQNVYRVYPSTSTATTRISDQIRILNNIRSNSASGIRRTNVYLSDETGTNNSATNTGMNSMNGNRGIINNSGMTSEFNIKIKNNPIEQEKTSNIAQDNLLKSRRMIEPSDIQSGNTQNILAYSVQTHKPINDKIKPEVYTINTNNALLKRKNSLNDYSSSLNSFAKSMNFEDIYNKSNSNNKELNGKNDLKFNNNNFIIDTNPQTIISNSIDGKPRSKLLFKGSNKQSTTQSNNQMTAINTTANTNISTPKESKTENEIKNINYLNQYNTIDATSTKVKDNFNKTKTLGTEENSNNPSTNKSLMVNLEDMMILEEKLMFILENLRVGKANSRNCLEWWSFYNYSNIGGKLETYFSDENGQKIARESCLLELISIITCYEIFSDNKNISSAMNILKNVIYLVHQNFLIICDYLITKFIKEFSLSNIWVNKLENLILSKLNKRLKKGENISVIKQNNENIHIGLKNIFRMNSSSIKINNISTAAGNNISNRNQISSKNIAKNGPSNLATIIYSYKNINRINYKQLNEHFKEKLIKNSKKNLCKIHLDIVVEGNENFPTIPVPYLNKMNKDNEFTLVLDLDETMIHFQMDSESEKGMLHFRPALFEFLEALGLLYELVVFTAATQDYADPIIDTIESQKKFFEYRLYRQHALIIENDFVKDLSKLGRDLSKIIIVDNMPQNFKLQKENGIFIKTFYGDDVNDTALIDLLPILIDIGSSNKDNLDVRTELKKYSNYILKKITTNFDKF